MSRLDSVETRSSASTSRRVHPNNLLRDSNRASTSSSMPLIKPEKRQRVEESGEIEGEDDDTFGSSSQKRARAIPDSDEDEDEDGDVNSNGRGMNGASTSSHSQSNGRTHAIASQSRNKAGILVRVKLQRFVTYDFVEFRPGPNLNMIIGPNGTGKSTIVCAIALGLGWKPSVLGRAKDVASYVKHRNEDALIELELKSKDDTEPNVVLERRIFTKDNRSEWRINGKKATGAELQQKVDEFGIDIGNLCCFLPQDKVADFARMGPAELLKETQKAAGIEGMTGWHNKLITYGRSQRELMDKLDKERDEVNNLEERNKILQKDVRRAEERQAIEAKMALLQLQIPYARYGKAKERYDDRKIVRNQRKQDFEDLKKKIAPLDDRLKAMERRNAEMLKTIKVKQRQVGDDTPTFKKLHEQLDVQESASGKLADKLASVRKREQEGKKIQAQLTRKVAEMEQVVASEPPRPNTSEIDAKVRAIKDELRNMKSDEADYIVESDEMDSDVKRLNLEWDQNSKELIKIDSVKGARLEHLKNTEFDVYKAVMWLREHQNMFSQPVNEPVMLDLSVKKPQFAAAVEACINWQTMKTFVCETREDYNTFTRELNDKQGLRLNVAEIEDTASLSSYKSPVSEIELKNMGFEHFVLDCIDAPDTIKRFLCGNSHLHTIPMAFNDRRVDIEAVERSHKFQRYIVGNNTSTITFSQYGNRLPQTLTRSIRPAKTLIHSIDQTRKRGLESKQQHIGQRKKELEEKARILSEKDKVLRKRMEILRRQQLDLEQEKGAAQKERSVWEKMVVNLNSVKEALAHEMNKPTAEQQTRELTADLAKVNKESQEIIVKIMALMQHQVQIRSEVDINSLKQLQYQEKVNTLAALKMDQEGQFQEAQEALNEAAREFTAAKHEAQECCNHAQKMVDEAPPDLQELLTSVSKDDPQTLEQLESNLLHEEEKLNLMIEVRPGVTEEYNQRRRKIEEINVIIQKLMKDKEKTDAKVQNLEAKWVTALEELVTNVSERFCRAFQMVGNAGEVRIHKEEDYDKWGIQIMVKFRDNEQLQQLTASRQSGGERSISTITYLLSLTEMSKSPFSLVDEINQGMDQKYERQVHNHMVNVTCKENAGQYFLITPKLLPHLTYHERMKVLVINNGEWLPEDGFNFGRFIHRRKALSGIQTGQSSAMQDVY